MSRSSQVRSPGDQTSNKLYNCVTATVVEINIWSFLDLICYEVPTTCISRILYIGDLRSGQFRDLPIISQWGKTQVSQILIRSVSNRSETCSIMLMLMISMQLCKCDPLKGHLRSYNDVMRSMYVFACNFWLDWDRDMGQVGHSTTDQPPPDTLHISDFDQIRWEGLSCMPKTLVAVLDRLGQ